MSPDDRVAPDATGEPRPVLRVVKGDPSAEELAALTAVVAAAGGGDEAPAEGVRRGGWSDPSRSMRSPLLPGPGAWRTHFTR